MCHAIDTYEYCANTVDTLQNIIRDKIENHCQPKIDMEEKHGMFRNVTGKGVHGLVSGLVQRTEPTFKAM